MPVLDVTLTLALPVRVTQLVAHLEAYREALPALDTLRACSRFGKGPQCHINKLPVELVQRIAHYCILPARKEKSMGWVGRLFCYQDECEILDHFSREWLLENYYDWRRGLCGGDCDLDCRPDTCQHMDEPNNEQLEEMLIATDTFPTEEHEDRREAWEPDLEKFLTKNRPLFQKHFGLDIWLSKVSLGTSWRDDTANTTIAYLVKRDRVGQSDIWARHLTEEGYVENIYESGCGMTVAMDQHSTSQDIQNFKRAMRILDLEVSDESSPSEQRPLSLALSTEKETTATTDTAASFPRPMLLIRNKVEGE